MKGALSSLGSDSPLKIPIRLVPHNGCGRGDQSSRGELLFTNQCVYLGRKCLLLLQGHGLLSPKMCQLWQKHAGFVRYRLSTKFLVYLYLSKIINLHH